LGRTFDSDSSSPLLPCQENPVSRKSCRTLLSFGYPTPFIFPQVVILFI